MKKFFALFLLSISLVFTSCSSLFDGQLQRGNRVVIKIPGKETKISSRNIYEEAPTDADYEKASFTVRLIPETGKILSQTITGAGMVIFENVTPGNWQADCTVSIKGKEDFAFAISDVYVIKKGADTSIPLTLSFNTIESIDKIEISKNYNPLEYDLGDEINKNNLNLDFDVTLKNGYTRTYSVQEMEAAKVINSEDHYFIEADVSDPDNVVPVMDGDTSIIAEKFNYFIKFEFTNNSWSDSKYTAVPVILNAKKPVIIEQPKSTNFYDVIITENNTYKAKFEITTDLDDTDTVSYEWFSGNECYSTDKICDYKIIIRQSGTAWPLDYQYFYCRVTNTEPEGVNGKNSVFTDSRKVVLEKWYERDLAVNHLYYLKDAKVCFDDTEFIASSEKTCPSPDQFYVKRTYDQGLYHEVSSFRYYDNEEYNITVEPVDNYDCYGNVPYIVTYTIPQHKIDKDTIIPAETYKEIVYIKTVFESVPVVNEPTYAFNVNGNYFSKRKYDFTYSKYYVLKDSGNYEEFNYEDYIKAIVLDELYTTVHYYNNTLSDSDPVIASEFNMDSITIPKPETKEDFINITSRAQVGINDSWEIKNTIQETTETYGMHPYKIRYYLSEEDFKTIENRKDLNIYLEIINTVSKKYEGWVKNKEPVISSTKDQMITYSRYD